MIVDTTLFHNELDILELRLNIMGDHVDRFVIVESDHSYMNKKKPYHIAENWDRFAKWHDKIFYIQSKSVLHSNPWGNEYYSRTESKRGWFDLTDNDIILNSDLDEIIRPEAIEHIKQTNFNYYGLIMPVSYYKLNYVDVMSDKIGYVAWGGAFRGFQNFDPIKMRKFKDFRDNNFIYLHHAGWHFSWMGSTEELNVKLENMAHQEFNNTDHRNRLSNLDHLIFFHIDHLDTRQKYMVVKLDDYFPKYILENKNKYKDWILPDDDTLSVRRYYPFGMLEYYR